MAKDAMTPRDRPSDCAYSPSKSRRSSDRRAVRSEIAACLNGGQLLQALKLTQQLLCSRTEFATCAAWLGTEFAKAGRLGDLVEWFWTERQLLLVDMYAIGVFMRLCGAANQYEKFRYPLLDWLRTNAAPTRIWPERAHLKEFESFTPSQREDFCRLKYGQCLQWNSRDFLTVVDVHAQNVEVLPSLSDYLYRLRADQQISYPAWLHGFRTSLAMTHVLSDVLRGPVFERHSCNWFADLRGVVEAGRSIFATIDTSNGLLLATFHGGLGAFTVNSFLRSRPDGVLMKRRGSGKNPRIIGVTNTRQTAGFRALKALRRGKILLMAPDELGQQVSKVDVLGISLDFADGAPLLALESKCRTGFYAVVREGNRLVPLFEPGPVAGSGEGFGEFKERWWRFYAGQLEGLLTGNPHAIVFPRRWAQRFQQAHGRPPSEAD